MRRASCDGVQNTFYVSGLIPHEQEHVAYAASRGRGRRAQSCGSSHLCFASFLPRDDLQPHARYLGQTEFLAGLVHGRTERGGSQRQWRSR